MTTPHALDHVSDEQIVQPYRWHHHVIFIASTLMLLWLALGVLPQ